MGMNDHALVARKHGEFSATGAIVRYAISNAHARWLSSPPATS
jgi:hypothetical protein